MFTLFLPVFLFFFNDTATTEIYTLSLHDALPISRRGGRASRRHARAIDRGCPPRLPDRKSTRLNSSHTIISYAVFCFTKRKTGHSGDPPAHGAAAPAPRQDPHPHS